DAAQDDHVVGTTGDAVHATVSRAGGAFRKAGQIVGAEANDRQGFAGQGGEDQFAGLIVAQYSLADRVDDFWAEVVFPDVATVLGINGFTCNAGAHEFGQTINIAGFEVVEFFDLFSHAFGPRFCTQDGDLQ